MKDSDKIQAYTKIWKTPEMVNMSVVYKYCLQCLFMKTIKCVKYNIK